MPRSFESFIALRYLRSKRKEVFISIITIISVLGVAISVMVLNIVLAVMTGFEEELKSKLIDAGAHIVIRRYGGDLEGVEGLISQITQDPEVVGAVPFTYSQAMISSPLGARGLLVRGIQDSPATREKLQKMKLTDADIDRLFTPQSIPIERTDGTDDTVVLPPLIVGKALHDRLSIFRDSAVMLFSPQLGNSPQGLVPKVRRFLVVGIYSSGLQEYESGLAYTSMKDAQRFFGLGDAVSGIEVTVKDLFRAKEVGARLIETLGGMDSQLYATDWTEPNKPLWDALRLEKQVYFIVLLLLILVASFSIVSTLVMVVMEKSRDIAVMKSMGAPDSSILRIFVIQGSIIGICGIVLGTALGLLGCIGLREFGFPLDESVFSLKQVPVYLVPMNFVSVGVSAFFITLFAGVYPALRAARLRPADALRFE